MATGPSTETAERRREIHTKDLTPTSLLMEGRQNQARNLVSTPQGAIYPTKHEALWLFECEESGNGTLYVLVYPYISSLPEGNNMDQYAHATAAPLKHLHQ
jgi:hypothetical protein